jgi:acyl dehydratase
MRLVNGFLTHKTPDGIIAVATGEAATRFTGMMRLNETAALIVEALSEETTQEALVAKMMAEYDVEQAVAEKDVAAVLASLRGAGLLVE